MALRDDIGKQPSTAYQHPQHIRCCLHETSKESLSRHASIREHINSTATHSLMYSLLSLARFRSMSLQASQLV